MYFVTSNGWPWLIKYFWYLLHKKPPIITRNSKKTILYSTYLGRPNVNIHWQGMMRTHVPNVRAFEQSMPWLWSWANSFGLEAMNLVPSSSFLWREFWTISQITCYIFFMASRSQTKAQCKSFTFFWFIFIFLDFFQNMVKFAGMQIHW